MSWLRERGATDVEEVRVIDEHMEFGLPRGVRESDESRAAGAQV
jgi:hypothetical protein